MCSISVLLFSPLGFPSLHLHWPSILAHCLLYPLELLLIIAVVKSQSDHSNFLATSGFDAWSALSIQIVFFAFWYVL